MFVTSMFAFWILGSVASASVKCRWWPFLLLLAPWHYLICTGHGSGELVLAHGLSLLECLL